MLMDGAGAKSTAGSGDCLPRARMGLPAWDAAGDISSVMGHHIPLGEARHLGHASPSLYTSRTCL